MHTEGSKQNPRLSRYRLAAVGLLTLAASLSAFAQTADTTTTATGDQPKKQDDTTYVLNKFTVTGSFAHSLEAAAAEKRNSRALVEVIAPEDIGKLPDVSIADALNRLPGITSQRVNGRDQQINIRGFSPDFNVGTLDGVEQASTNDNRAVEFDQYPSELVGGVTIFKTGQAALVGGLAGTIDLQTTAPLSQTHRVVQGSAFYNWTGFKQLTPGVKKAGESFNAIYIDQFDGGKEGIFVGFAHAENPYAGKQYQAWGYDGGSASAPIIGGLKYYDQAELLKRDSFVLVLESRPNDNIHSKLDFFYSKFDDNQLLDGMQIPTTWSGAHLQPGYTVANGVVSQYTMTNVSPVLEDLVTRWTTRMESVIWNLDLAQKSAWPVKVQAGISTAKRQEEVLEDYAGTGFGGSTANPVTLNVNNGGASNPPTVTSNLDLGNASLFSVTDPQGWGTGTFPATGQEGYLKYFTEKDVADSIKVSTKHEMNFGFFKDVEFGVGYSQRYKSNAQSPTGYLVNANGAAKTALPPLIGLTDLTWAGNIRSIAWDSNALYTSGQLKYIPNPNPGSFKGDDYKVWEDILRPYVQFDLKGELAGLPYDGDLGLVSNITKQKSNGFAGNGGAIAFPTSASASYGDVLPTLNLIFHPTSNDLIRLFVGRQEQRPRLYDMRAGSNYGYNATNASSTVNSPWSGNAGNPNLRPWMANSIDLDFEHYFAHNRGYFSFAVFNKKLLNYIYQLNQVYDFTGIPYTSAQPPALTKGVVSQFVNGQGGNVQGAEATLSINSELLSGGNVKGFSLILNGTLVGSNIQPWGPGNGNAPLPDMSKKSGNITLAWERYGFSARVNSHYQSATREYIVQFGIPTPSNAESVNDGFTMETPFHQIDAQVSYTFSTGPLKGLGLFLEGRNLNNAALITYYNGNPNQIQNWQKYGATYKLGLNYKF